jgi:hypothetical protein
MRAPPPVSPPESRRKRTDIVLPNRGGSIQGVVGGGWRVDRALAAEARFPEASIIASPL